MPVDVVSPAPCLPALLSRVQPNFELVLDAGTGSDADVLAWCRDLRLRDLVDGQLAALHPLTVTRDAPADLQEGRPSPLARVQVAVETLPEPTPPRRTRVFDLVRDGDIVRRRCVGSLHAADDLLRIAFASDLHIASIWDDIAEAIERHGPQWTPRLLHPTRLFERMLAEIRSFHARGEVDLVILGGDLIDHVYRRRHSSGTLAETNVPLLLDRIADLPVPVFAIPGNHDYRLYPWRARVYPFTGAGLPQPEARRIMKRAGLWDASPLHPRDLDSLRTREPQSAMPLRHHRSALAPRTDFVVDVGSLRLVFLSTGRDVLPRWRQVERGRLGMLLRSIPVSYHHPDCEGFSDTQIRALQSALGSSRAVALFFHAPLLNPPPGVAVHARLQRLDLPADDALPSRIEFERRLFSTGLRHGVFFRNPAPFARTLASFKGPLTAISGHVHGTHALELDSDTLAVRSVDPARVGANGAHVLLNAPALGQTATRGGESPGYLLARFDAGRLTAVQKRCLSEERS